MVQMYLPRFKSALFETRVYEEQHDMKSLHGSFLQRNQAENRWKKMPIKQHWLPVIAQERQQLRPKQMRITSLSQVGGEEKYILTQNVETLIKL